MKNQYSRYIILLGIIICVFSIAKADWTYGDFVSGTDGWFTDAVGATVTMGTPGQTGYTGSNGALTWTLTFNDPTTWASGDVACSPVPCCQGWDFTQETSVQVRIALTGSVASTNVQIYSKSGPSWTQGPVVYYSQNCDGNFVTYNIAIDTAYVTNPTEVSFPIIVQIAQGTTGSVTAYMDYAKSFGSLLQAPADVYADFLYDHEPTWIVNWDGNAVQGHSTGQNSTGLFIDNAPPGTLSWVDLNTTSSGSNIGASVSTGWGTAVSWSAYKFIEVRASVSTTGQVGPEKAISGQVFAQSPWTGQAINELMPIDGQFHTYSLSYDTATAAGAYTQTYNQIGLDLNGHGDSDVRVTIDYIKFKNTGSPVIFGGSNIAQAYTDPANQIPVLASVPYQFTVDRGNPPFTWSITSVSGNPGSLDIYSGATVNYTGSGGEIYLNVSDADGRSHRASINVTPTSAPLVPDPSLMDISLSSRFEGYE